MAIQTYVQRDKKTGEIVGGEDFQIRQNARRAIIPHIEVIEDRGKYSLKAINVNEPAHYTWYNEAGVKIAEGQEVTVVSNSNENYMLKVESDNDGTVNYAHTTVNALQGLKQLSAMPSKIGVSLLSPAVSNTQIRISHINSTANMVEVYSVNEGETEMTIYPANKSKGVYVICLLVNGKVIDSRQIVR